MKRHKEGAVCTARIFKHCKIQEWLSVCSRQTHEHTAPQKLQAAVTDHIVTASPLRALVPAPENVHLNLRLRVSAFPAFTFDFNSRRRIIILFPVFPISRLIFLGMQKNIISPEMPWGNSCTGTLLGCTASNGKWWQMNDELERISKEMISHNCGTILVLRLTKKLSQNLPAGTEENHENICHDSRCMRFATKPTCSVTSCSMVDC
jgi:hypothetical protein